MITKEEILDVLATHDPEALVSNGCDANFYDTEAQLILDQIHERHIQDYETLGKAITDVFATTFGEYIYESKDSILAYFEIAREIYYTPSFKQLNAGIVQRKYDWLPTSNRDIIIHYPLMNKTILLLLCCLLCCTRKKCIKEHTERRLILMPVGKTAVPFFINVGICDEYERDTK